MCISRSSPKTLLAWFCTEDFRTCLNLLKQRGLVLCSCQNSLDGEKDFIWPELARRREGLYLAWSRSTARRTLSGASTCPGLPFPWMHWGLSISSCLNSLEGEEDFLWCLNLPRATFPLDALRTFDENQIKEAFINGGRGHPPSHFKFFLLVFSKLKEDIK